MKSSIFLVALPNLLIPSLAFTTTFTGTSERVLDVVSYSISCRVTTSSSSLAAGRGANDNHVANNRRTFLGNVAASGFGILTVGPFAPVPVLAEVSQGNSLPEGAAQFKRLINLKSDIPLIIRRVSENASDIDKKEWDNLSDFLRRLYKGGDDMKSFAKTSIYDPEKKKKAEESVRLLQKLAQAGDGPVSKQDAVGYAAILKKSDDVLENFFELLRDVPDEL